MANRTSGSPCACSVNASVGESVVEAPASDAFSTYPDASDRRAVIHESPPLARSLPGKGRCAKARKPEPIAPPAASHRPYLVAFVPIAVPIAAPIERRLAREVPAALGDLLDSCVGTDVDLASLTLTGPTEETIGEAAAAFAVDVARSHLEGVLLVRGVGERGKRRTHYHGLLLTLDVEGDCKAWCERVNATARGAVAKTITGWRDFRAGEYARRFPSNLAAVLAYTFEPLPADVPQRDLRADVIASGAFASPWQTVEAALATPSLAALETGAATLAGRRMCEREGCGREVDPSKRSHARYCSPACRNAAFYRRTRAKRERAHDGAEG